MATREAQRAIATRGGLTSIDEFAWPLGREVRRERAWAPIFSDLVHGGHMPAQHDPRLDRDALVAEGVRFFVSGVAEGER